MNALIIESRALAGLIPYARNARTHSPEQVTQIAASIQEYGWTNPVLVAEEGGIIAGHGRVMAARQLGMSEVPVIVLRGLTDAQRRAYIIADNKMALNAGWDKELLGLELGELKDCGFDMAFTGFGIGELDALLAGSGTKGLTDPDVVPALPAKPVSRAGDVWVMGRHRLICGDCTEAATVTKVLNGITPHLMVTDPPYGIEYDAAWRNEALEYSEGLAVGKVTNDHIANWRAAWDLFPGDVAYVWHAGTKANIVADSLVAGGFEIRAQIIWAKQHLVISRGHYHHKHEPCWYAVRKGGTGHWSGDRKQSTVWEIDKPHKSETGHSTQKPVECMRRPIENNSSAGQVVYEPFNGSGTTIIAAEMMARGCYAVEILPAYVDMTVKRWQAFTGKVATLESDGRTFDDVLADIEAEIPEPA